MVAIMNHLQVYNSKLIKEFKSDRMILALESVKCKDSFPTTADNNRIDIYATAKGDSCGIRFLFLAPVLHYFLQTLGELRVSPQAVNEDRTSFQ